MTLDAVMRIECANWECPWWFVGTFESAQQAGWVAVYVLGIDK